MAEKSWALVTGASSGLGVEFARQLAARGHHLVLTARSEAPMRKLADEVRALHDVEVVIEPLDLSLAGSAAALDERLLARNIVPEVLVNNAAFGLYDRLVNQDLDRLRTMLQLDIVSLTELTYLHARRMARNGHGRILLVGSMAAYQPVPLLAVYAAAKAYVLSLGEALHVELAPKVTVTVLSPGLMDTGFNAASGYITPPSLKRMIVSPDVVARTGLKALFAGKSGVIAGRLNKGMAFASRLLPRHAAAKASLRPDSTPQQHE